MKQLLIDVVGKECWELPRHSLYSRPFHNTALLFYVIVIQEFAKENKIIREWK